MTQRSYMRHFEIQLLQHAGSASWDPLCSGVGKDARKILIIHPNMGASYENHLELDHHRYHARTQMQSSLLYGSSSAISYDRISGIDL